jgi:GNAT superfamily N-acetyltransferase
VSDVRYATEQDAGVLSAILAAAFYDDPVTSWVFPEQTARPAQLGAVFFGLVSAFLPDWGTVHLLDDASASCWRAPGFDHSHTEGASGGDSDQAPSGFSLPADTMERLRIVGVAVASAHPSTPHWYLNVLGTRPERQGEGLGARVLDPVLSICDSEGVPAYLESSNPRNMPFYRRLGFEASGQITIPDGPSLYPMWRQPGGGPT